MFVSRGIPSFAKLLRKSIHVYRFTNRIELSSNSIITRDAKQGGGGWGVATPLNFVWGVEHLSTPPDFEKIFNVGGWLPLKLI